MTIEVRAGPTFDADAGDADEVSDRAPAWRGPGKELVAGALLDLAHPAEIERLGREVRLARFRAWTAWAARPATPKSPALTRQPPVAFAVGAFADQVAALGGEAQIDLRHFACRQQLVEALWRRPEARRAALQLLQREGRLLPARHFCYETSRDDARYSERLGFSFPDLVRFCADPGRREVLLELGQGSGACLDRRAAYARGLLQVGCCDALRYTVRELLLAALDRDAIQRGVAARLGRPGWQAGPGFWDRLSTFAAKVLVIRASGEGQSEAPFDEDALAALSADANALVEVARAKAPLLATTESVPASEGAPHPDRPGEFVYPHWERRPADPTFLAACELLARDTPGHLLVGPGKKDALDVLPVYPCGAILGDFRDLAPRLRPGQVRLAVGVRSTQALEGDDYVDFMAGMARLLTDDDDDRHQGVYVDDNARKNYGRDYPLEELREAERRAGFPFFVVRGRGPEPWEDDVPAAVVVTRSRAALAFIADSLRDRFRLQRPSDMLDDPGLMARLPRPQAVRRAPPT